MLNLEQLNLVMDCNNLRKYVSKTIVFYSIFYIVPAAVSISIDYFSVSCNSIPIYFIVFQLLKNLHRL